MKLILGSDHGGFKLKAYLKKYLDKKKIAYEDIGAHSLDPDDDFPQYAVKVAKKVAKNKGVMGVLSCGNAQGICIAANKVKGARAATCYDAYTARTSRKDDDANIICLRGRKFPFSKSAKILQKWLDTPFSKEARFIRRLKQVSKIK